MLTLPVRWAVAVLAATLTLTLPFPMPLAPEITLSHDVELVAVHVQPFEAVTATVLVSPGASTVRLVALMEYVHEGEPAACAMVTICPAIVSVPVRPEVAEFAVAAKTTGPGPVAGIVDVIVSQLTLATAVQPHVAPALTVIEPVDAVDGSEADAADRPGAHGAELEKEFDS